MKDAAAIALADQAEATAQSYAESISTRAEGQASERPPLGSADGMPCSVPLRC